MVERVVVYEGSALGRRVSPEGYGSRRLPRPGAGGGGGSGRLSFKARGGAGPGVSGRAGPGYRTSAAGEVVFLWRGGWKAAAPRWTQPADAFIQRLKRTKSQSGSRHPLRNLASVRGRGLREEGKMGPRFSCTVRRPPHREYPGWFNTPPRRSEGGGTPEQGEPETWRRGQQWGRGPGRRPRNAAPSPGPKHRSKCPPLAYLSAAGLSPLGPGRVHEE
ncbi:uncharacterized protein LOC141562193 [Sminthopsis crassicaudata]|uniref:uncharacterized protein LOC141562193 n=1 Tax=Sminthopsis crassicaudata TaxID=9301 RepID=UPI003D692D7C